METDGEQMGLLPEAVLAGELGLSRGAMVELRVRYLSPGTHWQRLKRKVVLLPEGVERLRSVVGCPDSENKKNGQDGAPSASTEPVLLVVKRGARNIHILICEKKAGDGLEVRVRVRSNANFLPGMEIRATPHPEYDDFFDLVGRCPRQRGRW